jgi:ABC-type antimicrobial peptide transport system permease subunit
VTRRRREIGIRSALGANPRRLLAGIFARSFAQIGSGVFCGLLIAIGIGSAMGENGLFAGGGVWLLPIVATTITAVGLLATLGPARRGLAVQPTEALREE